MQWFSLKQGNHYDGPVVSVLIEALKLLSCLLILGQFFVWKGEKRRPIRWGALFLTLLPLWLAGVHSVYLDRLLISPAVVILSLLIARSGILGLVWFDTRFMRKEIALRKVNGATSREILSMINRKYLITVGISFVIATPIAYAICQRWMSQFAFRTNIPAWIFVVSFLAVVAITLAVVTLQSWRAANANPVDSLKNE
jgi:ABC-type antimicrobial peptide transport system permease subunit